MYLYPELKYMNALGMTRQPYTVSFAQLAQKHALLEVSGWKSFKAYVRNQKKTSRINKQNSFLCILDRTSVLS